MDAPIDSQDIAQQQDDKLARSALRKQAEDGRPTAQELAALSRVQSRRLILQLQRLTPKQFREIMQGMQTKQLHDWEDRYLIPCGRGRERINLLEVLARIRKIFAELTKGGVDLGQKAKKDQTLEVEKQQKQIEKLTEQINKLKHENEITQGRTIDRADLVEMHQRLAVNLRGLGERFSQTDTLRGVDAQRMLNSVITSQTRELKQVGANE